MDQNKALCPNWYSCNYIADAALQADNSKLAFYALEFLARRMASGENSRPAVLLSVDEGLVASAFGTAGRTYDSTLVDASWAILRRSLRQKRTPIPECYLGKINAHASLGNLQRAFSTLHEFESAYGNASEAEGELYSPFTSLHPLVVACSKNGFATLDSVFFYPFLASFFFFLISFSFLLSDGFRSLSFHLFVSLPPPLLSWTTSCRLFFYLHFFMYAFSGSLLHGCKASYRKKPPAFLNTDSSNRFLLYSSNGLGWCC